MTNGFKDVISHPIKISRNTTSLVDVVGKCGSVMFSAYRDDSHTYTEQNFITFSGSHVNIGSSFK